MTNIPAIWQQRMAEIVEPCLLPFDPMPTARSGPVFTHSSPDGNGGWPLQIIGGQTVDISRWGMGASHALTMRGAGMAKIYIGELSDRNCIDNASGSNVILMGDRSSITLTRHPFGYSVNSQDGFVGFDLMENPVRDITVAYAGQSNSYLREHYGTGVGGFQNMRRNGLNILDSINFVNGATGGTSVPKDWLKDGVRLPASNTFYQALDRSLLEGHPIPSAVMSDIGEKDSFNLASGAYSFSDMVRFFTDYCEDIQAIISELAEKHERELSGQVPIIVTMVGTWDVPPRNSNFTAQQIQNAAGAIRMAWLTVIESLNYVHHGAERYHYLRRRFNQVHLDTSGFYRLGQEDARVFANIVDGQENDLGPHIISAELSNDGTEVLVRFKGKSIVIPPAATLFGILKSGGNPVDDGYLEVAESYLKNGGLAFKLVEPVDSADVLFPATYGDDLYSDFTWRDGLFVFDRFNRPLRTALIKATK